MTKRLQFLIYTFLITAGISLSICIHSYNLANAHSLPTPLGGTTFGQALKRDLDKNGEWIQVSFADNTTQTTASTSGSFNPDGVSGGQSITGGTDSGDDLLFISTSNATKGTIGLGSLTDGLVYDEINVRLSIGSDENTVVVNGTTIGSKFTTHTEGATDLLCMTQHRHSDIAAFGTAFGFTRSRGTDASPTAVVDNDILGRLLFYGHDGTDDELAAQINAEVDGTVASDQIGGALVFSTTLDGTNSVTERMRIANDGAVSISTTNANGITFGSLGTATRGIDLENSGLSGASDYHIWIDSLNFWDAQNTLSAGTKFQVGGASGCDYRGDGIRYNKNFIFDAQGSFNWICELTNTGTVALFGQKNLVGTWDGDGVSNGTTTITDVGGGAHGILLAAGGGDMVHIKDATTSADEGFYRIISDDGTNVIVDRALSGSDTNLEVTFHEDVIGIFANGRIMRYSHDNTPIQIGGDTKAATTGLTSEDVVLGAAVLNVDSSAGRIGIGTTTPRSKLEILDQAGLASESIQDGNFSSFTNWTEAGDMAEGTNNYVYTHSGGTGSLTQASGDLTIAGIGDRWYKLQYTISSVTETGVLVATLTTGFAGSAVTLIVDTETTQTHYFTSKASPGDFVISVTSDTASDTFTIDDVTLKEVTSGDLIVNGIITGGGSEGIKILSNGNVGIGGAPSSLLDVFGDIEINSAGAFYYGDPTTDTTWKTVRDGTKLSFQRRESSSYVEKGFFDSSFHTDIIGELIADAGVTVDGVLLKDGNITITALLVDSNAADTTAIMTVENTGGNFQIFRDDASPEGVITGSIGDLTLDTTGGGLYLKISGSATNTGWEQIGGTPSFKSYSLSNPGTSGTFYVGGHYAYDAADANLTIGGTVVKTFGTANQAHGSHAFCVASGAGGTDLVLTVTGVSITDAGVKNDSDSEIIVADADAASTNEYFETSKKWLGQITYTLTGSSGTFDFNYGFAKYEDFGNRNYTVTDFEGTGEARANETGLNIELLHHESTAFLYHVDSFIPNQTALISMATDYGTNNDVANGDGFAYKRTGLSTIILAGSSEGLIIRVTTAVNNSINDASFHIGVNLN